MNLFRVIAILVVVWLVVYMVKRTLGQRQPKEDERPLHQRRSEKVVRCARCGVHVPESEAVREQDRFYCSQAHRDEDRD